MDDQSSAAIIANDLDSLRYRIEALPAHPQYTYALSSVASALDEIRAGAADLHLREMTRRHSDAAA